MKLIDVKNRTDQREPCPCLVCGEENEVIAELEIDWDDIAPIQENLAPCHQNGWYVSYPFRGHQVYLTLMMCATHQDYLWLFLKGIGAA